MALILGLVRAVAMSGLLLSTIDSAEARGFGGGFRGGGSMSMSRGGSFGSGSFSQRGMSSGGTFTRSGQYNRPATTNRPSDRASTASRDRPSQLPSAERPNRPADPGGRPGDGLGSGNANRPEHPIACPRGGCNGTEGWIDHPIAAGVVIGAVAGAAAAMGSYWYALPPDCPPYYWSDLTYYSCGGSWYQPIYEGETIVYVTVPDPSGGTKPPAQ